MSSVKLNAPHVHIDVWPCIHDDHIVWVNTYGQEEALEVLKLKGLTYDSFQLEELCMVSFCYLQGSRDLFDHSEFEEEEDVAFSLAYKH